MLKKKMIIIFNLLIATSILLVLISRQKKIAYWSRNDAIMCIPATDADMTFYLLRLLDSISAQTLLPREVVIVISNISVENCLAYKTQIHSAYQEFELQIRCVTDLQYQSISRQNASSMALGHIISFIDADDVMFPNRLEVISKLFDKYKVAMVLHGWATNETPPNKQEWKNADILDGITLYDMANKTIDKHDWLHEKIMHSQCSVLKDVFQSVKLRTDKKYYRTEDVWFIRDVITHYGRNVTTAVFINTSLAFYIPRVWQDKKK